MIKKYYVAFLAAILIFSATNNTHATDSKKRTHEDLIENSNHSNSSKKRKLTKVKEMSLKEAIDTLKIIINKFDTYNNKNKKIDRAYRILKKLQKEFKIDLSYILAFLSDNYNLSKAILEKHSFDKDKALGTCLSKRGEFPKRGIRIEKITKNQNGKNIVFQTPGSIKSYPVNIAISNNNINTVKAFLDYSQNTIKTKQGFFNVEYNLLTFAIKNNRWEISNLILEYYSEEDLLEENNFVQSLNYLLKANNKKNQAQAENLFDKIIEKLDLENQDTLDKVLRAFECEEKPSIASQNLFSKIISYANDPIKYILNYNLSRKFLKKLIKDLNIDPSEKYNNESLLFPAIKNCKLNLIKYLIEDAKIDINSLNDQQQNVLYFAKSLETAKYLISKGIKDLVQDVNGNSPYTFWALGGDPTSYSPFCYSIDLARSWSISDKDKQIFKDILDLILNIRPEQLKLANSDGNTLLHLVANKLLNSTSRTELKEEEPKVQDLILKYSLIEPLLNKKHLTPLEQALCNYLNDDAIKSIAAKAQQLNRFHSLYISFAKSAKFTCPHAFLANSNLNNLIEYAVIYNTQKVSYSFLAKELSSVFYVKDLINSSNQIPEQAKNLLNQKLEPFMALRDLINIERLDQTTKNKLRESLVKLGSLNKIYECLFRYLEVIKLSVGLYINKYKISTIPNLTTGQDTLYLSINPLSLREYTTDINKAIIDNNITAINTILQNNTLEECSKPDALGITPLELATYLDKDEIIQTLLEKKHKCNIINLINANSNSLNKLIDLNSTLVHHASLGFTQNREIILNTLDCALKTKDPKLVEKVLSLSGSNNLTNSQLSTIAYNDLQNIKYKDSNEKKIYRLLCRYKAIQTLLSKKVYNNTLPQEAINLIAAYENKSYLTEKIK